MMHSDNCLIITICEARIVSEQVQIMTALPPTLILKKAQTPHANDQRFY